jgi:hypothetical protein
MKLLKIAGLFNLNSLAMSQKVRIFVVRKKGTSPSAHATNGKKRKEGKTQPNALSPHALQKATLT